jgi:octaheme c-type cytochrome (tetrathionate reductase family)
MEPVKKPKQDFLKLFLLFAAIALPWIIGITYVNKTGTKINSVTRVNYQRDTIPKVDHSKFSILQQDFETPESVTEACLSCHNTTGGDIMKTSHWKWERDYITPNGDTIQLGKKNILNNFCIGVSSNEARCTSCHVGYGWKDNNFDFTDSKKIDCLICHDKTGTYKKLPTGAGYPATKKTVTSDNKTFYPPDYRYIAAHVGPPGRNNCGACHFVGGGGNNVKHGDIASELSKVTREVDVHMGIDGANMDCVDCHKTHRHNISGNLYSIASQDTNRVGCEQCHSGQPHVSKILNSHFKKVACQTCHIPAYAKVSATKMSWDWSTAGQFNEDGSFLVKKDSDGNVIYHTMKGSFVWKNNVVPEYQWFNGKALHYVIGEKVDTSKVVELNTLEGSYSDKQSKIIPVKVHRGKQIYDTGNEYLIVPHLFGKDSTAYWTNFDWTKASETGMAGAGLDYSGQNDFISTEMSWPINHMVAPAGESLKCADCHSGNSRIAALNNFYLIGRDKSNSLDYLGIALIALSVTGVIIHSLLRIVKRGQ